MIVVGQWRAWGLQLVIEVQETACHGGGTNDYNED